ncbi:hypothetical protein Tco_1411240 [Tanacetum coccineum]
MSIVETDKVIHTVETDIVKLVVEIKSFGKSSDEFDKETGSSDGLQPKQADLSCVHALNELHLNEIHVVLRGRVKMDDPNITMEEYIRLEEEKARRCGKVYNWETATYGKIWDNEDVHDL